MSRPPYFPFYVTDFAADPVVEAMSTEGVGAYILLLCKAWHQDPPASLPNTDRVLARYSRLTPDQWQEVKPEVTAAFSLGKDNRWHQKRLRKEYAAFAEKSEKNKRAANKRWENERNATAYANAKQRVSGSGSDSDSTGSEEEKMPGFDRWWKLYPNSTDRARALAYWSGKKPLADGLKLELEPMADLICEAVKAQAAWRKRKQSAGKFTPEWKGAAAWLHNACWLDECESSGGKPKLDPAEYSRLARKAKETWPDDLGHLPDGADAVRVAVARLQRKEAA